MTVPLDDRGDVGRVNAVEVQVQLPRLPVGLTAGIGKGVLTSP
jgi:hypothetical protein